MLTAAYLLSVSGMIILPIVLAFYLTRKFKLSWKLVLAGALTFIASQVLHIPVLYGLTALFSNGTLPAIPEAWTSLFNAILLGLLAGIFEETARWILFKFVLKNLKTWREGVLVGVGHGGVEAMLLGLLALTAVGSMIAMRNGDLSTFGIPADQIELTKKQVAEFWSAPVYTAFLGLIERVFAVCLHLSLSVMVLYGVAYRKPVWFWIALLWHALVDALAVYLIPIVGTVGIEAVLAGSAIISLVILFRMRPMFVQAQTNEAPLEVALRNFLRSITQPSLGFVIVFLFFSLLFLSNSYKLWFKTDTYYQDIYNSLTRQPSLYPFREFFLKRMENKKRWVLWQKIFSLLGLVAVVAADILVVMAYVK